MAWSNFLCHTFIPTMYDKRLSPFVDHGRLSSSLAAPACIYFRHDLARGDSNGVSCCESAIASTGLKPGFIMRIPRHILFTSRQSKGPSSYTYTTGSNLQRIPNSLFQPLESPKRLEQLPRAFEINNNFGRLLSFFSEKVFRDGGIGFHVPDHFDELVVRVRCVDGPNTFIRNGWVEEG